MRQRLLRRQNRDTLTHFRDVPRTTEDKLTFSVKVRLSEILMSLFSKICKTLPDTVSLLSLLKEELSLILPLDAPYAK